MALIQIAGNTLRLFIPLIVFPGDKVDKHFSMTTEVASIWDNFHQELRVFIQNKTRNSADTEDILQDSFLKIIHNWDKVNKSDNLRNYLFGIVRNTVYDHFKKKQPVSDALDNIEALTPEEVQSLNTTVAERCIKPFINKLPDHYREALLITEFQEVTQKELAERLGISYSGAKSRVQRGKGKLKELLLACCPYKSDVYGNIINNGNNNCGCA